MTHVPETASDSGARTLELARTFPTLAIKTRAMDRWDPEWFVQLMAGCSSGEREAAAFVLLVWNPHREYGLGKFDFAHAMEVWDREHRKAFAAWVREPWWA